MGRELPQVIKDVGFSFGWDERDVWLLPLSSEKISVSLLEWHVDIPFWETDGGFYDLTPRQVMVSPHLYPHHAKRVRLADISYPLDIALNEKTGQWVLLDGLHRLVRLMMDGAATVDVRKVPMEMIKSLPSYQPSEL